MSLILEALNRSRREQQNASPVPGVDSVHFEPEANRRSARWLWLLAAAGLILLAGFLLGGLFKPAEGPVVLSAPEHAEVASSTAAQSDEVPSTSVNAAPPISVEPVGAEYDPAGAVQPNAPTPAAVESSAAVPSPEPEASADVSALYAGTSPAVQEAPVATPPATARDERALNNAAARPADTGPSSETESSVDIAALAAAAEQALEDVRLAEHPAPFLGELSQQRKDAIPTLMYLQHDYRQDGGSSVTINGQQASAGQSVGRGVRVEEVLPDSVVLSQDGEQFRLRALNSWVNL
ncbi:MAG TPA: hypothetical protein DD459_11855 [Halieaceae bacterium]|nr:hypothetical protein [Halieaceae bacterium]